MAEECNGNCICVHCNIQITKTDGKPCRQNECPECGKKLMKEGSYHHQLYLSKKEEKNQKPPQN